MQNKVPADAAKRLHAELQANFAPQGGTVIGVQLWHYLGGPWQACARYPFHAPRRPA